MNAGLIGYLIGLAFAVYWLNVGAMAVGGTPGTIIFAIGLLILLGALWRVWINRAKPTSRVRFGWSWYWTAVVAEIIAMNIALQTLPADFFHIYQAPIIGTIVGLHFIGLWMASRMRRFLVLSGAMTALNLGALALPATSAPAIVAGLGSAALLAGTVAA